MNQIRHLERQRTITLQVTPPGDMPNGYPEEANPVEAEPDDGGATRYDWNH